MVVGMLADTMKRTTAKKAFLGTLPLSSAVVDKPPFSRLLNIADGHDIPVDGAVFPTAMFYTNIQIGTPPADFAVGIDSGSGDLFVEGKGCNGCTESSLNR